MTINEQRINEALQSWGALNKVIPDMNEEEVRIALGIETKRGKRRKQHVLRLHRRYCALRARRERELLMEECA